MHSRCHALRHSACDGLTQLPVDAIRASSNAQRCLARFSASAQHLMMRCISFSSGSIVE